MHLHSDIFLGVVGHVVLSGLGIVVMSECSAKWTHLIRDLLHWIRGRRGESCGRIIAQFLILRVIACFLKLHLEIFQETVVGWALRCRAAERETARSDVVLYQFAVVGGLARQHDSAVFKDVLEHGCLIWTSYY